MGEIKLILLGSLLAATTPAATANLPTSDGVYQEADGLVVMELENTPSDLDLWIKKTDVLTTAPTGTGYLEFTGNSTSSGPPGSPLEYTFKINQSGYYYIHLRCARQTIGTRTDLANDCYIRVEGNYGAGPNSGDAALDDLKTDHKYYGGDHLKFVWATGARLDLGGESNKRRPVYNFYAGETYKLVVSGRSQLFKLDRIVFRHDSTSVSAAENTALGESEILNTPSYTYAALDDFDISSVAAGDVPYYMDNNREALAIDAAELTYRDKFARAILTETVPAGTYDVSITAMRELDGECTYQLYVNDVLVGSKVNSTTTVDYALQEHRFSGVVLPADAEISVKSNDVSNERVAEDGGWAYARGRWTTLSFAPSVNPDGNPDVSFNTPSQDINVYVGADLSVLVDASDSDGIEWVRLYKDDVLIREASAYPYQWNDGAQATDAVLQNLAEGTFVLKAIASDTLGNESTASITVSVLLNPPVQQAEDYSVMYGIAAEECSDTGGGRNIGFIQNGDWMEYEINLPTAGTYSVDFRVASDYAGGTIQMMSGGSEIGTALVSNTGGWQSWVTVNTTASFDAAGPQTLRLNCIGGSTYLFNVNWFELTKMDEPSGYETWAATHGISGAPTDDDDGDGLNNLGEYAIGDAPAIIPAVDAFDYVYKQRTDDPALIYTLETCTNLVTGTWTNIGYAVLGTNVSGGTYNDVTNRISLDKSQSYVRLTIEN